MLCRPLRQWLGVAAAALAVACVWPPATARATIVWGNNASNGNVTIEAFDLATGALVTSFLVPNPIARADNGRGVAVFGTTLYYTTANRGEVFVTDTVTRADLGVLFNTGQRGISTIATDGAHIYVSPYDATGRRVLQYSLTGVLERTINIANAGAFYDGLEITTTNIIANRGDPIGPYDLYDLNGNLIRANFLATPNFRGSSGVAFDGTNYIVSEIFGQRLAVYDSNGTFLRFQTLTPPRGGRLLEDLATAGNVPPPAVPEPSTLAIASLAALGLAGYGWRRRQRAV